eukprot:378450-Hanusia_phi.AAC.2
MIRRRRPGDSEARRGVTRRAALPAEYGVRHRAVRAWSDGLPVGVRAGSQAGTRDRPGAATP